MANEKRLIDANALIKWLEEITEEKDWLVSQYNADWIWSMLDSAPTVDAVEVVRCKDCKHFIQEEHGCNHFGYYSHTPWVDEVDFCSYGERRTDGQT